MIHSKNDVPCINFRFIALNPCYSGVILTKGPCQRRAGHRVS